MTPYYDDGSYVIYHADCGVVLPQLSDRYRLILTSPPYNLHDSTFFDAVRTSNVNPKRSKWASAGLVNGYGSHGDAMPYDQYVAWQRDILAKCWATLTDDGAIFYNHKPRPFDGEVRLPTDLNPGLPVRQVIIWDRAMGGVNFAHTHYMPMHEWVLIFARSGFRLRDKAASGVGDVWRIIPEHPNNKHPAPFPVSLAARVLETTRPGLVLDPFMGSGTTLVAAKAAGRPAVGIEIDERYCEMAAKRLGQEVLDLWAG